jgi:hypothetical protein
MSIKADPSLERKNTHTDTRCLRTKYKRECIFGFKKKKGIAEGTKEHEHLYNLYSSPHTDKIMIHRRILWEQNENV